jgi:hypothetical protein
MTLFHLRHGVVATWLAGIAFDDTSHLHKRLVKFTLRPETDPNEAVWAPPQ